MGFLDSVRDYFRKDDADDYYEDDYYEDDDAPAQRTQRREQGSSNNLLGNTSRPEAESVSVYTRSGRPVSTNPPAPAYTAEPRPTHSAQRAAWPRAWLKSNGVSLMCVYTLF